MSEKNVGLKVSEGLRKKWIRLLRALFLIIELHGLAITDSLVNIFAPPVRMLRFSFHLLIHLGSWSNEEKKVLESIYYAFSTLSMWLVELLL